MIPILRLPRRLAAGLFLLAALPAVAMGDTFYTPPATLPEGALGSVIRSRALEGTMALPSAARNTLVLYRSTGAAGGVIAVSGTLAIPQGTPPTGGWPVISWTHGTTGLAAICAPSLDAAGGPEHPYILKIRALLDGFVRAGFAIAATDYEGLGVAGRHPFLQGVPNARNALDMLRAARAIEPAIGARYGVVGHSQGGHADLFTAAEGPRYAPEFQLMGNIAMAPGSHIAERLEMVRTSAAVELGLPYLLYVLQSYAQADASVDLARILTPAAIANLPLLQVGCMTRALSEGYWSTAIAREQFLPNPDFAAFLRVAASNEPGRLRITAPTLVMQGRADVTVLPQHTDLLVGQLCAGGNTVDYVGFPGADHGGVMAAGAAQAVGWMTARFAGAPTRGGCP